MGCNAEPYCLTNLTKRGEIIEEGDEFRGGVHYKVHGQTQKRLDFINTCPSSMY